MNYKTGQRIQAIVFNEIIDGVITGEGYHKGRKVYDLDCERFVYEAQILGTYNVY